MTDQEELSWIEAARQGDETAFEKIYHRYKTSLFGLAQSLMGNPEDAEDVLQEAFIRVFHKLPSLRKPQSLVYWLRQVVYRIGLDHLRKYKGQRTSPLEDRFSQPFGPVVRPPEEAAMERERLDWLRRALEQLPPRYRAFVLLRELDGLTYQEIADIVGTTANGVRLGLHRARKMLRHLLSQTAGEE